MKVTRLHVAVIAIVEAIIILGLTGYIFFLAPKPPLEEVRIGISMPLSPPGDYLGGKYQVEAYKLAAKEINEAGGVLGGRKISLCIYDDEGRPELAEGIVSRLVLEDKVCAIVGSWHSSVAVAIARTADKYEMLYLSSAASTDAYSELHSPWVFRQCMSDYDCCIINKIFIEARGYKRIILMSEDTDFGIGTAETIKEILDEANYPYEYCEIVIFPYDAKDFKVTLLSIREKKPDVLIFTSGYDAMFLIPKQAYELGLHKEMDIVSEWDPPAWHPNWWPLVGEASVGIYFPIYYHPDVLTEKGASLIRLFKEELKVELPVYDVWAFDALKTVAQAIDIAGSTDPAAIAEALRENEFSGAFSKIRFETHLDIHPGYWQKNAWCMVWWVQYTELNQHWTEAKVIVTREQLY